MKKESSVTIVPGSCVLSNGGPLSLIAGPCVIESERLTLDIAAALRETAENAGLSLIFKASYDKANRSSAASFRGPGLAKGLKVLAKVKERFDVPILTDVHEVREVAEAAKVADILQIPAFLCRQTDLVVACARTGKAVNVKKGQFMAPDDMANVIKKIEGAGNRRVILTERGTSFGYHNLVVDMRGLSSMKKTGYPVVFDATHAVQLPGGLGDATGGEREYVEPLSRAAVALGIAGVFVEVHPNPARALSDGPNSLPLSGMRAFAGMIAALDRFVKSRLEAVPGGTST